MDEHTMAELSLPISPAPDIDLASQVFFAKLSLLIFIIIIFYDNYCYLLWLLFMIIIVIYSNYYLLL